MAREEGNGTEALIARWKDFNLTQDEERTVVLEDEETERISRGKDGFTLIGKIISNKPVNREACKNVLKQIWSTEGELTAEGIGKNLFIFQFQRLTDKNKVISNGPWYFDKSLILFEELKDYVRPSEIKFRYAEFWIHLIDLPIKCLNKKMAIRIGNLVGEFIKVEADGYGNCWGDSLRVRVRIDISKPLRRGVRISIGGNGNDMWIPIKYEKLPDFCYNCGMIDHNMNECEKWEVNRSEEDKTEFGPWLRYTAEIWKSKNKVRRESWPTNEHSPKNMEGNWREKIRPMEQTKGWKNKEKEDILSKSSENSARLREEENPIRKKKETDQPNVHMEKNGNGSTIIDGDRKLTGKILETATKERETENNGNEGDRSEEAVQKISVKAGEAALTSETTEADGKLIGKEMLRWKEKEGSDGLPKKRPILIQHFTGKINKMNGPNSINEMEGELRELTGQKAILEKKANDMNFNSQIDTHEYEHKGGISALQNAVDESKLNKDKEDPDCLLVRNTYGNWKRAARIGGSLTKIKKEEETKGKRKSEGFNEENFFPKKSKISSINDLDQKKGISAVFAKQHCRKL